MKRKIIVVNVDFFDELSLHGESMGPDDVENLVKQCKENGVDRVTWRAAGWGVAGYPTKVISTSESVDSTNFAQIAARLPENERKHYEENRGKPRPESSLERTLKRMDPIATAKAACKRHGVEFYIWIDIIDERNSVFLNDHPECQVMGRDGKTPWPGLRSYANADAVANELELVDELLEYSPDGLYLSLSCHSRFLEFPEPADWFGFEEPIAQAYKAETGKSLFDISTTEEYDIWHRIKGDFFTEFLRKVKGRASAKNARIMVGTQFGKTTNLTCPYYEGDIEFRFETQWKRWVDEGIADALVLGDYEWPWDRVPTWIPKGFTPPPGKQVADMCAPEYVEYIDGRVEALIFSSWLSAYAQHHNGASAADLEGAMRMRTQTLIDTGLDGICLHEAHTFEYYDGFDTISEMRATLDNASKA